MGNKSARIRTTTAINGVDLTQDLTQVADNGLGTAITLPAGLDGTLTTRTDANTGVVTLSDDSVVNGDYVDLYWDDNGTAKVRYGLLVSGVTTTTDMTINVDGGAGDDLPVVLTALTLAICSNELFALDGSTCVMLAAYSYTNDRAVVNFVNASYVSQFAIVIDSVSAFGVQSFIWSEDSLLTNPIESFTGIARVLMGSSGTAASRAGVEVLYN